MPKATIQSSRNDEITQSTRFSFSRKVVTIDDIRRLAAFIEQIPKDRRISADSSRIETTYSVTCFDGTEFESKAASIFDDESPIITKRVRSLNMTAYEFPPGVRVHLELTHGHQWFSTDSYLAIQGKDAVWVKGVLGQLRDIVDSFAPQNSLVKRHKLLITSIFALGIGMIYWWIVSATHAEPSQEPPSRLAKALVSLPLARFWLKYLLEYAMGFFPAFILVDKLSQLWPDIEIQIGPEHELREKGIRKWISGTVVLLIIPILVAFVYDFLKSVVIK